MLWNLIKKELVGHILEFRFGLSAVLCTVLALASVSVLRGDLAYKRENVQANRITYREQVEEYGSYRELERRGMLLVGLPFGSMTKEAGGGQRLLNVAGVGATMGLLGFDFDAVAATLKDTFARHGGAVLEQNLGVARRAYGAAAEPFADRFDAELRGKQQRGDTDDEHDKAKLQPGDNRQNASLHCIHPVPGRYRCFVRPARVATNAFMPSIG